MKYIAVGGHPFVSYTGTITFTGINLLGVFDSKEEANGCCEECYDECGGLIAVFGIPLDQKTEQEG